ncbi:hypothetical protein K8I28_07960 [bacterium]|nr:hypothetical protein [bacterium]
MKIVVGDLTLTAELNNTLTARAIIKKLPLEFAGDYWGEELYGSIPVYVGEDKPVSTITEPGTLAYWPLGNAFCIFWGPTPISQNGEIRPATPVNIIGKIVGGLDTLITLKPKPIPMMLLHRKQTNATVDKT